MPRCGCKLFGNKAEETMPESRSWELLNVGAHGDWYVAIDNSLDDEPLFSVQLERPGISAFFRITSLSVVNKLIDFLNMVNSTTKKFEIEDSLGRSFGFILISGRLLQIYNISPGVLGETNSLAVNVYGDDIKSLAKALQNALDSI